MKTGLDILIASHFAPLKGKRVGLVTHTATLAQDFRSTVQVFSTATEFKLATLFGPEHGLTGEAQDLIPVKANSDGPVRLESLYGETFESLKPTSAMLVGLDVLVIRPARRRQPLLHVPGDDALLHGSVCRVGVAGSGAGPPEPDWACGRRADSASRLRELRRRPSDCDSARHDHRRTGTALQSRASAGRESDRDRVQGLCARGGRCLDAAAVAEHADDRHRRGLSRACA